MSRDYNAVYEQYRKEREANRKSMSEAFWTELRRFPAVVQVRFSYAGHGDEGSVNEGVYLSAFDPDEGTMVDPTSGVEVDGVIDQAGIAFAYTVLEEAAGGWDQNDGSQGTIIVNVRAKKVRIDHEWNVSQTASETFEIGTSDL